MPLPGNYHIAKVNNLLLRAQAKQRDPVKEYVMLIGKRYQFHIPSSCDTGLKAFSYI